MGLRFRNGLLLQFKIEFQRSNNSENGISFIFHVLIVISCLNCHDPMMESGELYFLLPVLTGKWGIFI